MIAVMFYRMPRILLSAHVKVIPELYSLSPSLTHTNYSLHGFF